MDALDWASREQDLLLDLAKTGAEAILHARLPSHAAQLALSRLALHNPQTQFLDLLSKFLSEIDLDSIASRSCVLPEHSEWTNHGLSTPSVDLISSLVPALLGRRDQPIADFFRSLHAALQQSPQSSSLISLLAVISSALVSYSSSLPLDPVIARSLPCPDLSSPDFHQEPLNQCTLFLRVASQAWIKIYEPFGWDTLVSKGFDSPKASPSDDDMDNARETCRSSFASLKRLVESYSGDSIQNDIQLTNCLDAVVDSVKYATILTLHGNISAVEDWTRFLCEIPLDLPTLNQESFYGHIHDVAQDSLALTIRSRPTELSLTNFIANYLRRTVQIPDTDFAVQLNGEPNPVLVKTAKTLACALEYLSSSQDDIPISTAYALLNSSASKYIASATPSLRSENAFIQVQDPQTENTHTAISENNTRRSSIISTTTVATHLTLHFRKKDMIRLVISMLLQRLRASSAINVSNIEEENILIALVTNVSELATEASELELGDIVRALADVSHSHHSSVSSIEIVNEMDGYYLVQDKVQSAILVAQTRIAKRVAQISKDRPSLRFVYLRELLALFVDRSVRVHPERDPLEKKKHLISLIPVIDALIYDMLETDSGLADNASFNQSGVPDDLVTLFRDFWFIVVLFDLCQLSTSNEIPHDLSNNIFMTEHQLQALKRIATKTPCLVRATAVDYLERDLEYNSVLRKHSSSFHSTVDRQRGELAKAVPQNAGQIRHLSYPQTIFFLAVLTLESMRAEMLRPSAMLSYFSNEGINSTSLFNLLASIADQVNEKFRRSLNHQVVRHSIDSNVYLEIKNLLVKCCRPSMQIRKVSIRYVNSIVNAFPSLFCHEIVVNTGLEMLTILRRSCEASFSDQYSPVYTFHSQRTPFRLVLPDDYSVRNEILVDISGSIRSWFAATISRAPMEMRGLLLAYLDHPNDETFEKDNLDSEMGKSVALDLARALPGTSKHADLPSWGGWKHDTTSSFVASFGTRKHFSGQALGFVMAAKSSSKPEKSMPLDGELHMPSAVSSDKESHALHLLKQDMRLREDNLTLKPAEIRQLLYRAASALIVAEKPDHELLCRLVKFPISIFSPFSVSTATEVWAWLIYQRSELEERLMTEISLAWNWTIRRQKGFFSDSLQVKNPLEQATEYSPTDRDAINITYRAARRLFGPHHALIDFLSSRFQAFRYNNPKLLLIARRLLHTSCVNSHKWNTHPLARELWNKILLFGFAILQGSSCEAVVEYNFREAVYNAAFVWFEKKPRWSFGSNRIQLEADIKSLQELHNVVSVDPPSIDFWASAHPADEKKKITFLRRGLSVSQATDRQRNRQRLLLVFLESEIEMLNVWLNPLSDNAKIPTFKYALNNGLSENAWKKLVHVAWSVSPSLAIRIAERFPVVTCIAAEVAVCVTKDPHLAVHVPEGLQFLLKGHTNSRKMDRYKMRHILYWAPVPPVTALRFFEPSQGGNDPLLLQYAMRVMEQHPVPVTFFYIPQVVQALRIDHLGYVERFIFETAKISQLFCHQIIWNIKANFYKDDNAEVPDPMKSMFERTVDMIVASLSGEAKSFYEREFRFFDNVTSISKKLQPFVKKSKAEKKAKIDEEMSKIEVDVGVYLPSNPDGIVIDIDRKSGRPLQSHAKTPFMATFKLQKERKRIAMLEDGTHEYMEEVEIYEVSQSAMFKVGDDTRQDMLALQIIAQCKNIFSNLGLHLQVIPYRVIATGPGSGLIEVIPNATSRDEMGRAKINDLTAFFMGKYGGLDTIVFQEARINFIQSMAAYSLLCYIIQIKDRHNGNIMIDGEGRICHVDFGFLFDIDKYHCLLDYTISADIIWYSSYVLHVPDSNGCDTKGVKFEPNSFKLNREMVVLMGGRESAGYRMFCELTVKAFLAVRPYVNEIVDTATLMMGTGLPSFRGEGTLQRLRERFRPDLSERQAAAHMISIIDDAFENARSTMYDRKSNLVAVQYEISYSSTETICRVPKRTKRVSTRFDFPTWDEHD